MTEYHYTASGKFYPGSTFLQDKWNLSGTYVDGSQSYTVATGASSPAYLDIGLTNYLSFKHQTSAVFSKEQTFQTQFSVLGADGSTLASPTLGYGLSKCTYTVTDGDWSRGGGYFGNLIRALLTEKYGLSDVTFTCDFGTFQVTTWMFQPRGTSSAPSVPTTVKPVDNKPAPKPVEVVEVDALDGTLDIFGSSAGGAGDY